MSQIVCEATQQHRSKERERARKLRESQWWKQILSQGVCHYCGQKVGREALTMDHKVPIARGGRSNPGNVVASCRPCNAHKSHRTPADLILENLAGGARTGD